MINIIYANRNRDLNRIKASLDSLQNQSSPDFQVIFVDYGSNKSVIPQLETLISEYSFTIFFSLEVPQLLWNKSKALNFGIKQAVSSFIFIADVDLVFHPETIQLLQQKKDLNKFQLFKLGYLDKKESQKLSEHYEFDSLNPARFGEVNGMILTSRESLMKVNGLDEFFHFYGAEDEDLFARLENSGLKWEQCKEPYFFHQWHQSFSGSEDTLLTGNPRLKNIMRVNQRHFQRNRDKAIIRPLRQEGMGEVIDPELARKLENPDIILKMPNILSRIEHLLREELPSCNGEIIRMEFFEDAYYPSVKHQLKKILGKQTQPYISMKEVNDMVLKEILFNYRDHNYSFEIKKDLKNIIFTIEL